MTTTEGTTVTLRGGKTLTGRAVAWPPGWVVLDNGHGHIYIPFTLVIDLQPTTLKSKK